MFILIPVLAFTPGLFWLWIAYRWDKYQPEPRWLVIRTFLLGMAVVIPVALIETLMGFAGPGDANASLSSMAYEAFIIAGVTEELAKFLVVYFSIYKNPHFDESTDGIVYASAAALGFASLENLFYMISFGWEVIALRAFISTLGHLLFSVIWGYPLALRKIKRQGASALMVLGLVGAMLAHGFYDFVLFTQSWFTFLVIPIMIGLIVALVLMIRHSRKISAFRIKPEPGLTCPKCAGKIIAGTHFCTHCGADISLISRDGNVTCSKCGGTIKQTDAFCYHCGNKVTQ
jgi:protease PrsW